MTRIALDGDLASREAVKDSDTDEVPQCEHCDAKAAIWIRLAAKEDLFLCDIHAFHLARILVQDIGHAFEKPTTPNP